MAFSVVENRPYRASSGRTAQLQGQFTTWRFCVTLRIGTVHGNNHNVRVSLSYGFSRINQFMNQRTFMAGASPSRIALSPRSN
jgi:hypothetical protein